MRILIIGCGYLGIPLGQKLAAMGYEVFGLRRSGEGDEVMSNSGIKPVHADISSPASLDQIQPSFEVVVNTVSSSGGTTEDYERIYFQGTKNVIRWLRNSPPKAYLYTSSTSVYGQTDGEWVTEASAIIPNSPTSRVLVQAEQELLRVRRETGFPASILRVAGIYGPGRGHLFKQYVRGEATIRDNGQSWLNMIHVEDAAGVIAHLLHQSERDEIYNVADNEPVTQIEFFRWLAERLGKSMPASAPPDPNRKRGVTNKRVSNEKLVRSGYQFIYPTFREGYAPEIQMLLA